MSGSKTGSDSSSAAHPSAGSIIIRCFRYLRPYWPMTAGAYVTLLLVNLVALASPQFIRWIVDQGIRRQQLGLLAWAVAFLLVLTAVKGVLTFFQGRWSEVASQGVAYDLRNALYYQLSALSFAYHDRTETGQLLSRAIRDVERVRFLTGRAVLRMVDGAVLLLGTAVVLFWMDPRLAALAMVTMPLLAYRAYDYGRLFRPLSLAIQDQLGVLTTRLEQNLRGARVVKAFAQEEAEVQRFERSNRAWFELSARAARLQALNVPLLDLIANASTVLIIWYGGSQVINGQLTLGELVAFTTYLSQLVQPVRRLGAIVPAIAQATASGERIFEILDAQSEVQDAPDARLLPPIRGEVVFDHVSFGYLDRHKVLRDVSFTARAGQVVALLGATGAGKSTVTNLISRFYDPTAGTVTVDGYDIRTVTLESLRAQVGIVLQETILFAASIRENVAFGLPDAGDDEIVAAAQAAQAHDFIMEMPQGYDTHVGEQGVTLSGGQKQRVAIARALLKDPRILILDDATASVDSQTEQLIQRALERLMAGRTSFVIAQRLSTVRMADLILVLDQGRIAATGTHDQLLERSPLYAEIYERQLRPQETETMVVQS